MIDWVEIFDPNTIILLKKSRWSHEQSFQAKNQMFLIKNKDCLRSIAADMISETDDSLNATNQVTNVLMLAVFI